MRGHKLLISAVFVFVTLAAAITAIIIFRDEITDFFVDIIGKIGDKKTQRTGEFADYADI